MRGRLRVVADGKTTWAEVFSEYWAKVLEKDQEVSAIDEPILPIREEREYGDEGDELSKEDEGVEDDKLSFESDSSNVDSSDSEVDILPKKKKRFLPPNLPYRTRKKGRYSMLRGLFKNTEDTPIVLDDTGPDASQPSQEEVDGKGKCKVEVQVDPVDDTEQHDQVDPVEDTEQQEDQVKEQDLFQDHQEDLFEDIIQKIEDSSPEDSYNSDDERMAMSSCDAEEFQFPEFNEMTGRPKKKRDKTNDIIEKRANDPTMMKRTDTSLKCGWCNEWGHNTRTCNSKRVDQEKKLKEDGVQPDEGTSKERTCTKCKQVGHNKRTCKIESVDTNNGKKPTCDKKNEKKPNVKPPVQQPNVKSSQVKHVLRSSSATATHGGIIRPFKPPTQKKGPNFMDFEVVGGQKFTSLKNLQATGLMMQKNMGKRKDW
ncbi:hypothetical protein POM88_022566 [Heracleum sosnowskyi]|uniref:Uncharacterized protein n=1 Tax=Heracleum sosnowskyi TaxID=360622 RepID=A0AAD8IG28_9APIA|nr:hypothetical protein POM88_022566 [Heracleum sosnowskyi]